MAFTEIESPNNSIAGFRCVRASAAIPNKDLPFGITVARWVKWGYLDPGRITIEHADLLYSTYEEGFGSRGVSHVVGQNLYLGRKGSSRPVPTLTMGPSAARQNQLQKDNFIPGQQPTCEALTNFLSVEAATMSLWLDRVVYQAIRVELKRNITAGAS